jgi:hypothetical protein
LERDIKGRRGGMRECPEWFTWQMDCVPNMQDMFNTSRMSKIKSNRPTGLI